MDKREKVIKGLECCAECGKCKSECPYDGKNDSTYGCTTQLAKDALALLKAQEPRVMTKEEIKDYLDDPDGDKKPLWLEWHSIPALSGWVLASQVSDLMKRYMDSYNNTWRPWTSRPTDEQRAATPWEAVTS